MIPETGREGKTKTEDQGFGRDFAAAQDGVTPEHLFVAARFHRALKSAARRAHHDVRGSTVIACARRDSTARHASSSSTSSRRTRAALLFGRTRTPFSSR